MDKVFDISNVSDDIRKVILDYSTVVKRIGVFGSLARGDYNMDSDIDILVEYNATPEFSLDLFTQFCEVCNQLSDILTHLYHRDVDIVHFENI